MKLTILQVGETPKPMRDRYERFEPLFENMFMQAGADFTFETIAIVDGAPFPDVEALEGVIVTGSAAGGSRAIGSDTTRFRPRSRPIRCHASSSPCWLHWK